ncbi:hypothetical protein [uncultured Thermanaerothrix sp.]|uniref:hypothetical protein n=1 Tax=uncultured Thermanaerothrix sp. TaxID=1195149 RepID=UPI00260D93A1|nr:hypothetical protein [uncultured Thermanaerothrix sp.]
MDSLNLVLLTLHNLTRWAVIILGSVAFVRAARGWIGRTDFTPADTRAGALFTIAFDSQILLGLILYITRGWGGVLIGDFGAAMREAALRFFAVEHILIMLIALGIAHMGRALSQKAPTALQKHRRAALGFGLALLLSLAAIPWPFLAQGRPWLRLFGIQF